MKWNYVLFCENQYMRARLVPFNGAVPEFDTGGNPIKESGIVTTFFGRIIDFKIDFRSKEVTRKLDGTTVERFVTIFADSARSAVYRELARKRGRKV